VRRQQPVQAEPASLVLRERRALVQDRAVEEIDAIGTVGGSGWSGRWSVVIVGSLCSLGSVPYHPSASTPDGARSRTGELRALGANVLGIQAARCRHEVGPRLVRRPEPVALDQPLLVVPALEPPEGPRRIRRSGDCLSDSLPTSDLPDGASSQAASGDAASTEHATCDPSSRSLRRVVRREVPSSRAARCGAGRPIGGIAGAPVLSRGAIRRRCANGGPGPAGIRPVEVVTTPGSSNRPDARRP
jgi:hypothetical protein